VKQLVEEFKGRIHLVVKFAPYPYRDFAKAASRAALAAREQGAFWPMHEKLLENYRTLDQKKIEALIAELKLDRTKFLRDMEAQTTVARVEEDLRLCEKTAIYQTPTFFINGRTVIGERSIEALRAIVSDEMELAQKGRK